MFAGLFPTDSEIEELVTFLDGNKSGKIEFKEVAMTLMDQVSRFQDVGLILINNFRLNQVRNSHKSFMKHLRCLILMESK